MFLFRNCYTIKIEVFFEKGYEEMKKIEFKKVIRWVARLMGIGIVALLAFFLIAESITDIIDGSFGEIKLPMRDVIALICIPGVLFAGILISWKKEIIGGLIILGSFVFFNVNSLIFESLRSFNFDFWFVFLLGILTIVSGILHRPKSSKD